jgi:hypothetical protein
MYPSEHEVRSTPQPRTQLSSLTAAASARAAATMNGPTLGASVPLSSIVGRGSPGHARFGHPPAPLCAQTAMRSAGFTLGNGTRTSVPDSSSTRASRSPTDSNSRIADQARPAALQDRDTCERREELASMDARNDVVRGEPTSAALGPHFADSRWECGRLRVVERWLPCAAHLWRVCWGVMQVTACAAPGSPP